MMFAGCDPGKTGCLCLLNTKNNTTTFFDWPKDDILGNYFATISKVLCTEPPKLFVLERVHSMPKQGVKSMFSFGQNYGCWLGFLAVHQLPHKLVLPSVWMRAMSVPKIKGGDIKKAVQDMVTKLYPKAELFTPRGKYLSGRGDALLMARYACSC